MGCLQNPGMEPTTFSSLEPPRAPFTFHYLGGNKSETLAPRINISSRGMKADVSVMGRHSRPELRQAINCDDSGWKVLVQFVPAQLKAIKAQ